MKNYAENYYESKNYILSYKLKDDQIIIKYANREKKIVPYTKEEEKRILSKMEEQAMNARIKDVPTFNKLLAISQPLALPIAISNFAEERNVFFAITLLIVAAGAIGYPIQVINHLIKTKDIEKMAYFINNKKILNRTFEEEDNNINIVLRTSNEISNDITINNIDKYSLKDLKKIKKSIEEKTAKVKRLQHYKRTY